MIKFVCDRCRCEVYMSVIPFNRKAIMLNGMYRNEYDLCKKCFYEVRSFITGEPNEQTERSE